ncbi:hypothetical protein QVD17_20488 [Tagetes erecta]|uniref:F-box domain-containing protein n=1 Tax=Tagetes erecta TaxID=13708 RepID=A0AAD8KLS9_TARER|nr:hypothetical protein QVD17_20488 [Tagetes erecta]
MVRKLSRVKYSSMEMMNDDDRISRLPDGVIDHIFSFLDTRSVVQSGLLSRRWRNTWKSHLHLNFEFHTHPNPTSGSKFPSFVHRFLSMRDDITVLSTIEFRSNSISLSLLREIITYAMSHRTQKLKIEFLVNKKTRRGGFDISLFRSRYLQHLFLSIDFEIKISPPLAWDFPALTTLNISRVTFSLQPPNDGASKSIELFSQLPNLTTLTLDNFVLLNIDTFIIMSSKLESLSLTHVHQSYKFVVSAPKLSSFTYTGTVRFSLVANDLLSLKTVNFQMIYHRSYNYHLELVELMIDTFQQLYTANSLILNLYALKMLSAFPELLVRRNCPFRSLQSLTLDFHQECLSLSDFSGVFRYLRGSMKRSFSCKRWMFKVTKIKVRLISWCRT